MRHGEQRQAFTLGLIAIATVAVAAGCGSSGNEPDSTSTPTTQTATTTPAAAPPKEFVSKRYAFRVTLTRDWSEEDAQVSWDGKKLQGLGSPAFANFTDPSTGRTLVAAAAPVAKGTKLAGWRTTMVRAASSRCSDSPTAVGTTLGGEQALAWTATCSDGYDVNKLAALHGQRGYMIFLPSVSANDDAVDRSVFSSIRRSFQFIR
jgi:hypothetical protein